MSSEWQNQALATVATTGAYSDLSGAPTLGTASAEDVGTSAGNVVQLNGSAQLPAVDGSLLTGITADVSTASVGDLSDVTITSASANELLKYNGSAWVNASVAYSEVTGTPSLATVATSGSYADLSNTPTLGTASAEDVGTFAQTANNLSDLANASTARTNLGLGTASVLDAGTSANNVVQLNGSAQLPAVDGSLLTGITADVSTASIGGLADVTITSAANGDALVYDGTNWRDLALATVATTGAASDVSGLATVATTGAYSDLTGAPVLATVATTGDYDDLVNAPASMIGSAEFITNADALNLVAGKHYIIGTANASTKTMTLPEVSAAGEYIRVTNWGDGELVIQVDQVSTSAYMLVGNSIVQNGQVTIESRATVDLFGFDYVAGGYEPAWGVYFSSSIETNTRSFNTTGQLPVYDAINKEFSAGDAGDLTLSYSPTNYTSAGNGIADHLGGIDTELGLKADSSSLATVATTGAYSDLSGLPTLGTASAEDVGTSAGNVVQLNGSAQLPAVDGSLLTNIQPEVPAFSTSTSTTLSISVPTGSESAWLLTPTANATVTLSSPTAGDDDGKRLAIKNLSAFDVLINGSIDGGSSFTIDVQYGAITLWAYNGAWYIV